MHLNDQSHSLMPVQRPSFPVAEGIGVFLGVIAWDLLSEGYVEATKALLIAAPVSIGWFVLRRWKQRRRDK